MPAWVRSERQQDVAVLTIDNAPVNVVISGVPEEIVAAIAAANADAAVRAIVLQGKGRCFVAGADINQFTRGDMGDYLAALMECNRAVEDSAKPVVAAIHGSALGAGLELSMSAHYRIFDAAATVGQPEVNLGLIPGAGATQRLPRLVGAVKAAQMCALGGPIHAREAKAFGLADRVADDNLLRAAVSFAREIADEPIPRTRERSDKLNLEDRGQLDRVRAVAQKKRVGEVAPLAAIDAIEAALHLSFDDGLRREQELFQQCLRAQAPAMIHLFFAERAATKVPATPVPSAVEEDLSDGHEGQDQEQPDDAPPPEPSVLIFAKVADNILRKLEGVIYLDHAGTRLVEVVCGQRASAENISAAFAHAKSRGKAPIMVRGYAGDRLFRILIEEALRLVREGAGITDVNNAMLRFGLATEPLIKDGNPPNDAFAPEEIIRRITDALGAECARLVEEGVVDRASDLDLIAVLGYGYPAWRGGPVYSARTENAASPVT